MLLQIHPLHRGRIRPLGGHQVRCPFSFQGTAEAPLSRTFDVGKFLATGCKNGRRSAVELVGLEGLIFALSRDPEIEPFYAD